MERQKFTKMIDLSERIYLQSEGVGVRGGRKWGGEEG